MPISSQASKDEGSTTTGLPDTKAQASPKTLPPNWGENIVSSAWKHAAVKQAFEGNWVEADTGCWEWTKGKSHGYGQLRVPPVFGDYPLYAHRVSYVLHYGPVAQGMFVCHKCDNPMCVNPEHLFQGTQEDNLRDMANKKRSCLGEKNGQSKLTDDMVKNLRVDAGLKQYELAVKYGISEAQVSRILRGSRRSETTLRLTHGNAKLTEALVLRIYEMQDQGIKVSSIARELGLNVGTVRDAAAGKTWKRLFVRRGNSDSARR